ncbi:MAG TPA: peptidoglycan-associated lipoprotein Pal [Candidatus Limnocylindrales bacterium]|nr:peptidoglycan-associated lipoprotein Pal [Candidatus Limnocylindrales bacterium]
MRERRFGKWGAAVLAVMMLFAFGCAKKQAVKSSETGAPSGAETAAPAPEGIATETMKPEPPAGPQVAAAEAGAAVTQEKPSPFQDIRFDFDRSAVREDAKPILAAVADYMKKNRGAKLVIEGHCDERGTSEYNMALGDRRAESTRAYLASLGVPASALSTVSFGKEKPLDPGHNEGAWAKNRRAHFVLR